MNRILRIFLVLTLLSITVACGEDESQTSPTISTVDFEDSVLRKARFSPDGTQLALIYNDLSDGNRNVMVMDMNGENQIVVSDDSSMSVFPIWSADGESLIFDHDGEEGSGIYRVAIDGSDEERLLHFFGTVRTPDLSPDGTKLVFSSWDTIHIYDLNSEDSSVDTEIEGSDPRYSPDGSQIAFFDDDTIYVMDDSGENVEEIFTDSEDLSYLTGLAWLPDGQQLAFTSQRGIELVDLDTRGRTTIYDGFATMDIDVSPDGKTLVFAINGQTQLNVLKNF